MLTTRKVHELLADVLQEIKELNEFMIQYDYKLSDRYQNPRTGQFVPGASEDHFFSDVVCILLGKKEAYKNVLGITK